MNETNTVEHLNFTRQCGNRICISQFIYESKSERIIEIDP